MKEEAIDFFDVMKALSANPAIILLAELIQSKDNITNIGTYSSKDLNPTERNRTTIGYKQLMGMNLAVRVKRGHYLLNPRLSPPYPEYYDSVQLHWIKLTGLKP